MNGSLRNTLTEEDKRYNSWRKCITPTATATDTRRVGGPRGRRLAVKYEEILSVLEIVGDLCCDVAVLGEVTASIGQILRGQPSIIL